tara:strand:- start:2893 stop:3078 length:186 start_codon:yes stop_codon:yes gene_type:complete
MTQEEIQKQIETIKNQINLRLNELVNQDGIIQKLQGQLDGINWIQGEQNGIVKEDDGEVRE